MNIKILFLAIAIEALTVFSDPMIKWNNGMCGIHVKPSEGFPSQASYLLVVEDMHNKAVTHIEKFFTSVYLQGIEQVEVYSLHNRSKVLTISLLGPTSHNNCPVSVSKVVESNHRVLSESCYEYTDCYNCSMTSGCFWCSSLYCEVPGCRQATSNDLPWWYSLRQCYPNERMLGVCPHNFYEIEGDYQESIQVPSPGHLMPKNGFCSWRLKNYRKQTVTIEINRKTDNDKLTIAGDTDAVTLNGNTTIQFKDSTISFYYMATDTLPGSSLFINIIAKDEQIVDLSYIAVVLVVMIALVFLYGVVACVRYCMQNNRSAQVATQFQSREWLDRANERYNKILSESPEAVYDPGNNKYAQTVCSICLAEFEQKTPIRKLVCSHIFHKACIEAWIKSKINNVPKCPMCNTELTRDRPPGFTEERRVMVNPANNGRNNQNEVQEQQLHGAEIIIHSHR